ncbi:MAG: hypothetical protein AAFZ58_16750 [Pseudomonadota bacterium]
MQTPEVARPVIASRLVVATLLVVSALAITLMVLEPAQLAKWIAAIAFLPAALAGTIYLVSRRRSKSRKLPGQLRAALVGAGVLLATALLFAVTDALGWTQDGEIQGRGFLIFLPAIVAVIVELVGMRLEHEAAKDPDSDEHDDSDAR